VRNPSGKISVAVLLEMTDGKTGLLDRKRRCNICWRERHRAPTLV